MMKRLLCIFLAVSAWCAAKDPFVGKWIWNAASAKYPPLTLKVENLESNRYYITFTGGELATVIADGTEQHAPSGGTISLRQIDGQTWQLIRKRATSRNDLFKIAPDGRSMTITTIDTLANKEQTTGLARWRRAGSGTGLVGEWKLASVKNQVSTAANELDIAPFGKDGLSFLIPAEKSRLDLKFDGNDYESHGPNEPRGSTVSGKRVNKRVIHLEGKQNGEPMDSTEYRLAPGGVTMSVSYRLLKGGNQVITGIYQRQ